MADVLGLSPIVQVPKKWISVAEVYQEVGKLASKRNFEFPEIAEALPKGVEPNEIVNMLVWRALGLSPSAAKVDVVGRIVLLHGTVAIAPDEIGKKRTGNFPASSAKKTSVWIDGKWLPENAHIHISTGVLGTGSGKSIYNSNSELVLADRAIIERAMGRENFFDAEFNLDACGRRKGGRPQKVPHPDIFQAYHDLDLEGSDNSMKECAKLVSKKLGKDVSHYTLGRILKKGQQNP